MSHACSIATKPIVGRSTRYVAGRIFAAAAVMRQADRNAIRPIPRESISAEVNRCFSLETITGRPSSPKVCAGIGAPGPTVNRLIRPDPQRVRVNQPSLRPNAASHIGAVQTNGPMGPAGDRQLASRIVVTGDRR
jgi:hypothetical protein